jgi:outer membrane protein assembly factor BamB
MGPTAWREKMMRSTLPLTAAALVAALTLAAPAADWPQYRGPNRSGVSSETGLLKSWPKEGPTLVWTFDKAGTGYSGPAVVGGNVFIMGCRDETEYLFSLDTSGKERWAVKIGPLFDFNGNNWSRGPNATPSVDQGLVYGLGSQGVLVCVDADGKEVWRKDLPKDMEGKVNNITSPGPANMGWGYCWSPLVDGDKLIIVPGGPKGLLAALDKKTGKELWRSSAVKEQATYSSPIVLVVDGVRQYAQVTQNGVVGVDAKDGSLLWSYKREDPFEDVVCPTPVVKDNRVYVTAWGAGAEVLEITRGGGKFAVKSVWSEKDISNIQGGVILVGDLVYGFNGDRSWECQEFATGTRKWESRRGALAAGSLIAADGMLFCLSKKGDKGDVALLEASPDKYVQKGRFSLPEASKLRKIHGGVWTHPVLSDGMLYLRDQEYLFCYQVK